MTEHKRRYEPELDKCGTAQFYISIPRGIWDRICKDAMQFHGNERMVINDILLEHYRGE